MIWSLVTRNMFIPEMHLEQPEFACSASEPLIIEAWDWKYIYQNKLDKLSTWYQQVINIIWLTEILKI